MLFRQETGGCLMIDANLVSRKTRSPQSVSYLCIGAGAIFILKIEQETKQLSTPRSYSGSEARQLE